MAQLSSRQRNRLADKSFALPGRRYPIHDKPHARAALQRVSQHGSPAEKVIVRKKVSVRYPGIAVSGVKKISSKRHGRHKVITSKVSAD